ncbi:hypothetical protein MRX96_052644, partial [Rhipicephalus microplus]
KVFAFAKSARPEVRKALTWATFSPTCCLEAGDWTSLRTSLEAVDECELSLRGSTVTLTQGPGDFALVWPVSVA